MRKINRLLPVCKKLLNLLLSLSVLKRAAASSPIVGKKKPNRLHDVITQKTTTKILTAKIT